MRKDATKKTLSNDMKYKRNQLCTMSESGIIRALLRITLEEEAFLSTIVLASSLHLTIIWCENKTLKRGDNAPLQKLPFHALAIDFSSFLLPSILPMSSPLLPQTKFSDRKTIWRLKMRGMKFHSFTNCLMHLNNCGIDKLLTTTTTTKAFSLHTKNRFFVVSWGRIFVQHTNERIAFWVSCAPVLFYVPWWRQSQ